MLFANVEVDSTQPQRTALCCVSALSDCSMAIYFELKQSLQLACSRCCCFYPNLQLCVPLPVFCRRRCYCCRGGRGKETHCGYLLLFPLSLGRRPLGLLLLLRLLCCGFHDRTTAAIAAPAAAASSGNNIQLGEGKKVLGGEKEMDACFRQSVSLIDWLSA